MTDWYDTASGELEGALERIVSERYPIPTRMDARGRVHSWNERHLEAAQMRSQLPAVPWEKVAAVLGVKHESAKNYVNLEGFSELVISLRNRRIYRKMKMLEMQKDELVANGIMAALATLGQKASEGSVFAAREFLAATGYTDEMKALAKYKAMAIAEHHGVSTAERVEVTVRSDIRERLRAQLTDENFVNASRLISSRIEAVQDE